MGTENQIRRGEIYYVHLDPCFGREIGGYKPRPVVVVSIEDIHQHTRIVAVIPGTTTSPKVDLANVVAIGPNVNIGLEKKTFFQCHQIRAIDQGRMTARPAGRMSPSDFRKVEAAVWTSLGWLPDHPT